MEWLEGKWDECGPTIRESEDGKPTPECRAYNDLLMGLKTWNPPVEHERTSMLAHIDKSHPALLSTAVKLYEQHHAEQLQKRGPGHTR